MSSRALAGETESFLRYGLADRLEVGFGYLWRPKVVRPIASYTLLRETKERPSLATGLMFDSLGGGRQGAYVSVNKSLRDTPVHLPLSVYIGGAKITNENGPRFIAGLNLTLTKTMNASLQFDGKFAHYALISRVGSVGSTPIRLGVVYSRNHYFGPLFAVNIPLGR
jgi:hypothetical protein